MQQDDQLANEIQPFSTQIPKAITLTDQSYSLEFDMLTGWVPKIDTKKMLALNFANELNDSIIQEAFQNGQLLYLGFRPLDTGQLHKHFANKSSYPYKHCKVLNKMAQKPFLGMNPNLESTIIFDSAFEGGNLDAIIRTDKNCYDLYIRVDSNTKGHTLWYNFEIRGLQKGEQITLNICNFRKQKSLYERGMMPFIWRSSIPEWLQDGEDIEYRNKFIGEKQYNNLSFRLTGAQDSDIIKIAYCVPYTFSQLLDYINELTKKYDNVEKQIFCETMSGIQVPLLTFGDGTILNKKCLIVQARIHPGESNGSWVMQGFLDYLQSSRSQQLLKQCIIKVVPMMNPDGVILGNYRTGVAGRDLNRRFKLTDEMLFPTVYAMKQLVKETYAQYGNNLIGFFDFHGHSVKKNVFLYGPEFTLWNYNYYKCRIFPKLLSQRTEMFRYYSSIFRISHSKRSTARGVFCDLYDLINCFTIETSNGSYYNQTQTFNFQIKHWLEMGEIIGETLSELIEIINEMDAVYALKQENMKKSGRQMNKRRSFTSYQEEQLLQTFQNTKFQNIFCDIKNQEEKMDQSISEGRSDSESSEDDYSECDLLDFKDQIEIITTQPKSQKQQKLSILKPRQKDIKEIKSSPKTSKDCKQISMTIQQSDKRISICSRSQQNSIIKKNNPQQQRSGINSYINNQYSATIEYKEDQQNASPLKQLLTKSVARPSTAQLEIMNEDEKFLPFYGFSSLNNVFKRHSRLRSNLTVNKQIKEKKQQEKQQQQLLQTQGQPQVSPPLIQQMSICIKTQTNFESLGLKVKPKHFLPPKKQENSQEKQQNKILQLPIDPSKSIRQQKSNVPPSFYSVKRHMMMRLKY